jgi:hypothetical protein
VFSLIDLAYFYMTAICNNKKRTLKQFPFNTILPDHKQHPLIGGASHLYRHQPLLSLGLVSLPCHPPALSNTRVYGNGTFLFSVGAALGRTLKKLSSLDCGVT